MFINVLISKLQQIDRSKNQLNWYKFHRPLKPITKKCVTRPVPNLQPKGRLLCPSTPAICLRTKKQWLSSLCISFSKDYVGIIPIPPPPMPPPPLLPKLLIKSDPLEELLPPGLLARDFFAPPENFLLLTPELL